MDATVKPCDDFFQYANGTWMKNFPIPDDKPLWGAPLEMEARNQEVLKSILEEASSRANWQKGSLRQQVGDFYASGMDITTIEREGFKPLASRFAAIEGLRTPADLAGVLASLHSEGSAPGFGFGIDIDDKQNSRFIPFLVQAGLSLRDRDSYLREDERSKTLLGQFQDHVARMFQLQGDSEDAAKAHASTVLMMETRLAKASMDNLEMRDPNAVYHLKTRAQLTQEAPGFPWEAYFKAVGLPSDQQTLLVRQPRFMTEFAIMAASLPGASWRPYLRWHLLQANAGLLSEAVVTESFAFRGKLLLGMKQERPRWKRVAEVTEQVLGDAVGQLFVARAFPPEAKQKALALAENLRSTLKERIQGLDWMTPTTKARALEKLAALRFKMGYPDRWTDLSKLEIKRQPYVLNMLAAARFQHQVALEKLCRTVERDEWEVPPSGMMAHCAVQLNEVCFPAGILQPTVFDPAGDDALNYGAAGVIIGHELTHGFDDQGRKFDGAGNLKDWWTPEDAKAYEARTMPLVTQFASYRPLPDLAINGELTLGENISDFGGLKLAFEAFKKTLQGKSHAPGPDGFTPEQRFFIAFAQGYMRRQLRPEYLRRLLKSGPHSPPQFRVNGPLSNLPEFWEAFGCGEGSGMTQPTNKRSSIW
jgi:predicted metalloendopeptidase